MKLLLIVLLNILIFTGCLVNGPPQKRAQEKDILQAEISVIVDTVKDTKVGSEPEEPEFLLMGKDSMIFPSSAVVVAEEIGDMEPVAQDRRRLDSLTELQLPCVKNLNLLGTVIYRPVDTMFVGEPTRIHLIISKKINSSHIIKIFKDTLNILTEKIRVSRRMAVQLHGSSNYFIIEEIIKNPQTIEDSSYSFWMWDVTPLLKGEYPLTLNIYICGDDSEKLIESYVNTIKIQSNEKNISKVLSFWEEHWQWIWSALIIPVFLFFKKKKKQA